MTSPGFFVRDVERFNAIAERCGAVVRTDDGLFVDPSKLPVDVASAYRQLRQHGEANTQDAD